MAGWLLLLLGSLLPRPLWAASQPCSPPNLIPASVCDFDSFRGDPPRQIPNGWTEFVLSGELTFMQDVDTLWGAPSLRMWSNGGTFRAGIYTQVPVTPGAGYRASIAWGAPNAPDTFGRQLGIDPSGGTDPDAATLVWGPMHWGDGRLLNYPPGQGPNIDVRARAEAAQLTVFFLVDHNRSTGDNFIFVDAIALYPDESAPALAPPTAAPLPAVVAAAPPPVPLSTLAPPTAVPPPPELATATASPSVTATPSPSPTQTVSPTPTTTPRWTPWPTVTAVPTAASLAVAAEQLRAARAERPGLLWAVGLLGLGAAGLCSGSLWWLRQRW